MSQGLVTTPRCTQSPPCGSCWYCEQARAHAEEEKAFPWLMLQGDRDQREMFAVDRSIAPHLTEEYVMSPIPAFLHGFFVRYRTDAVGQLRADPFALGWRRAYASKGWPHGA